MVEKFRECLRAIECLPLDASGAKLTVLSILKLFQSTMSGKAVEGVSEEMLALACGMSNSDFPLRLFRAWLIVRGADGGNVDPFDGSQKAFAAGAVKPIRIPIEIPTNDLDNDGLVPEVPMPDDTPLMDSDSRARNVRSEPSHKAFARRNNQDVMSRGVDGGVHRETILVDADAYPETGGKDQKILRPLTRVRTTIPSLPFVDLIEYVGNGIFKAMKPGTKFESLISKHHVAKDDGDKLVAMMNAVGESNLVWSDETISPEGLGEKSAVPKKNSLRLS